MIVTELILLISAVTASIIALLKIIHKSRVSFCRSKCCNLIDIQETREIDNTPDNNNNNNNNISSI